MASVTCTTEKPTPTFVAARAALPPLLIRTLPYISRIGPSVNRPMVLRRRCAEKRPQAASFSWQWLTQTQTLLHALATWFHRLHGSWIHADGDHLVQQSTGWAVAPTDGRSLPCRDLRSAAGVGTPHSWPAWGIPPISHPNMDRSSR